MPNYIYESPDGGRTVYRRIIGNHEKREQMVLIGSEDWMAMSTLIDMGRRALREQGMRNENPALQSAWDSYHALLRLLSEEDPS